MKVFMLGWEFPPFISGGLGTACFGLTKAMSNLGIEIIFVLPRNADAGYTSHVRVLSPGHIRAKKGMENIEKELKNVTFKGIDSFLMPYDRPEYFQQRVEQLLKDRRTLFRETLEYDPTINNDAAAEAKHYGHDIFHEVHEYANEAVKLAALEDFDIIHAHDWMTYPAAAAVAAISGRPLVVHVHSTEFDRSGEHVNQRIYDIERMGMHAAQKIVAVSYLTRNIIISRYGIPGDKVEVVYNGVDFNGNGNASRVGISSDEKIVLFLGRITMQKGPEYFLDAARKVLDVIDNVKFVMAGSGDMMQRTIEMAAGMGIGQKVLFTGFLRGDDVRRIYEMADLYVMPSVSEPFGIAPLEALNHDVPVLISKQSGVAEVLTHVLKVDFWDTSEMANKIIAVLKHPPLSMTLREHGNFEVRKLRWEDAAQNCVRLYSQMMVPC